MPKGDAFERKVEKYRKAYELPGANAFLFTESDVAKLLRDEHRATVRMVNKLRLGKGNTQAAICQPAYQLACQDILTQLNAKAK